MLLKWNNFATIYLLKFVFINLPANSHQGIHERRLLEDIFGRRRYNQYERPVANESDALIVTFGLTLQQIIAVDEKNQIINTNIWLNLNWTDSNLSWNKSEYGGLSSIRLPPKSIWKPDILMYNSADEDIDSTFPTNVIVSSNGACLWVPPGMFLSTCKIDITWFPFDDQKCTMKFGSWTYDGESIDLRLQSETGDISSFIENGEWKLIGVPAKRNVNKYDCCPTPYYDITFTIEIRRRKLFYVFNMIVPCVMMSALSLLQFAMPPGAGEKITMGVTILLSLTVFLLLVAETMPPTSDAVPLIGMYFACIMVMCSLSIVFTVLVLNFHHRTPDTHDMPKWVKVGICQWLAWMLRMTRPGQNPIQNSQKNSDLKIVSEQEQTILNLDTTNDIRMNHSNNSTSNNGSHRNHGNHCVNYHRIFGNHNNTPSSASHNDTLPYTALAVSDIPPPTTSVNDDSLQSYPGRTELRNILKELKFLADKVKREEEFQEICSDWKFAAMVIDRMCMIIFTLFTVVSSFGILYSAPGMIS